MHEKSIDGGRPIKVRTALFTALFIVLATGGVLLAQSSPLVGSWKINIANSKFDPGPPPQSQTRTWDAAGMQSVTGVGATGKSMSYGYPFKGDGKEYPTVGPVPNTADMVSTKKIGANTYEANFTKAGKHVETATFKVSNGGKTLTIHAKGATDAGPFDNLSVWDKQ
jgi:hypothetical protein